MAKLPTDFQLHEDTHKEQEVHLLDYARVILHRKWVVVIFFCTVLTSTAVFTLLQTPMYEGVCKIRIYKETPKVSQFEEVMSAKSAEDVFMRSETEMLSSHLIAKMVVNRLHLELHPEFTGATPSPGIRNLFGLLKKKAKAKKAEKEVKADVIDSTVNALLGRIKVVPIRASQLVTISASARDPALSALMANTLSEEYIRYNMESKIFVGTGASEELVKQLQNLKNRLEESERKLYEYAKENDMVALGETESLLAKKIEELNKQLSQVASERIKTESLYVQSVSLNPGYLPAILKSDIITDLERRYADINSEYRKELERVQSEHPNAKQLKAKLDTIAAAIENEKQKIANSAKEEYVEVVEREKSYMRQMGDLLTQKEKLEGKLVKYKILKRDVETNNQLYDALLKRTKEITITSEVKVPNVTIIDRALVPNYPYKPKKKLNLMLGAIVGLFGGLGLAFFIEYLDTSVKSQEDIERKIGLTFLGAIPNLSHGKKGRYY
ncbi:MAG: GumC family protein [Candidatus Brocadiaceae bacterium]|nr:GumC family protein [Candidatus Brocadiaceae bacterium]